METCLHFQQRREILLLVPTPLQSLENPFARPCGGISPLHTPMLLPLVFGKWNSAFNAAMQKMPDITKLCGAVKLMTDKRFMLDKRKETSRQSTQMSHHPNLKSVCTGFKQGFTI